LSSDSRRAPGRFPGTAPAAAAFARRIGHNEAVSPIDEATLDTDTPQTLDGRAYPEHLRPYLKYDKTLLAILVREGEATFDELARGPLDARVLAALPRWLASAQWRGLIERSDAGTQRRYALTQRGRRRLRTPSG